ncbi:MAG: hypothetical protein WDN72_09985 [Alphaproteobacteria bacterium]
MKIAAKIRPTTLSRTPIRTHLKLVAQRAMMPEYGGDFDRERNKAYYR